MSREWPGGVIRKTPVTPTGPYQDGTAPGVWTLDQMNYWLKQNLWPIAGNPPPFDLSNIIIPILTASGTLTVVRHNWTANTTTSLGSQTNWSAPKISVAVDPSKNVYILASSNTSTATNRNVAYLASGSSTPSFYRYYSNQFTTYGDFYGQLTWNPSNSVIQTNLYPTFNEPSGTASRIIVGSSSVTLGSSIALYGYEQPDMEMLRTIASDGKVTYGSTMLAQGGSTLAANNNFTFSASSPYTTFSTVGSSLVGNASRCSVASLSGTQAVMALFGRLYYYNGGSQTNISAIGGISSSSFRFVAPLSGGAFIALDDTREILYAYGSASTTPTWSVNLSSLISGRRAFYLIGVGQTLYIVSNSTASPFPSYITQVVFNLSTGAYTSTDRALGVNMGGGQDVGSWRYY